MFENLFDLADFEFADLINQEKPWESLAKIDGYIESKSAQLREKGFQEKDGVFLSPEAKVDPSAKFTGKAIVGPGTEIRDNALIRGGVVIGKNCTIGHATEVKHSIILDQTNAAHFNYVGDSILGGQVNLGAGTILANDKTGSKNPEVTFTVNSQIIHTGLRKFGALLGDKVKVGSNVVTDPGTIIGQNTIIYPLSLIRGTIGPNKIVKNRSSIEIAIKE